MKTIPRMAAWWKRVRNAARKRFLKQRGSNATDGVFLTLQGLDQANEGLDQANEGFDQANEGLEQANEGLDQANEGLDQANEGLDQANEGLDQANEGFHQANEGLDQANEGLDQANEGLDQANEGLNASWAQTSCPSEVLPLLNPKQDSQAEVLPVAPEDGSWPGAHTELQNQRELVLLFIQNSVTQHLPRPPADVDQNVQQHLQNVQAFVCSQITSLGPHLDRMGLKGVLFECYHHQIIEHLNNLLQNLHSSQNFLVLTDWVMHSSLSQELLLHPDLQETDFMTHVDLLLLKAKEKLLEHVKGEVRRYLVKVLQIEERQKGCDEEEACIGLYVDTIQVREVCFQELLTFLRRYSKQQTELLGAKTKMETIETKHFFKTLKTCKELRKFVQDKGEDITKSLLQETMATLDNLQAFTLKLLQQIIGEMAKNHLKNYFKANAHRCSWFSAVENLFHRQSWCQDVLEEVVGEAYKLITHIYLKHLVQRSRRNLTKSWSPNVGEQVTRDAELLHKTFSGLAPGVHRWALLLLTVPELLEPEDTDGVKVTVAFSDWRRVSRAMIVF
ncbi:uncharacterized protein si:dkey-196h17.9 isoform X2 [Antennarius striatus]|uniref:uncharacterized protein si:dkey-196h17.9 isoform X2 n=1 Tax=Antennarius striatus TaxID=241820 RepID=UPI0035B3AF42